MTANLIPMLISNRFSMLTVPLFFLFATFVVYICQRLVEQTAIALEPMERRAAFLRTSSSIGCLVWSLDAAGQFMYPEMVIRTPHLIPAVLALLVMVGGALATVPALTDTRNRLIVVAASLIMALSMFGGHILLFRSFGTLSGEIRWSRMLIAVAIMLGLAAKLALRHRSERMRAFHGGFRPLSWPENMLAGATIIPLHVFLAESTPLIPTHGGTSHGEGIVAFVLLGAVVACTQLYLMNVEAGRRKLMDRAHARLRTLPDVPGMSEGQQLSLIAERLPQLLTPKRLQFHFQPIMPLSDTGAGIRFEALLRIEDRELGRINPEMFILACTRVGKQDEADRMIVQKALRISKDWLNLSPHCAGISVNLSPETINGPDFVNWIGAELARYRLPHQWLKLEITEHTMIAASPGFAGVLSELKTIGIGVILDDFGTGFSSLGVMSSLPLEGLKIDRSLTWKLEQNRSSRTLLKHLSAMGKDLGMQVTVEGAESEEQLAIICRERIDSVQGYVFSKPLPAETVPAWIDKLAGGMLGDDISLFPAASDWLEKIGNSPPPAPAQTNLS